MQPLIAEMFGHRHRRPSAAAADQRRLVRGGGDHHRPRHARRSQHPFGELAQLAAAFADQRDDDDIRLHPARKFRQQHGFADTGTGKEADPLALHQGQQRVKHRDPGAHPGPETAARCGGWGGSAQRAGDRPAQQRPAVQRLTKGVDDPTDPAGIRRQVFKPLQPHLFTHPHPVGGAIGQHRRHAGREMQDFTPPAGTDPHPVTQTCVLAQACHLHRAAPDLHHPADHRGDGNRADFGQKRIENLRHFFSLCSLLTLSKGITLNPW